MTTKLDVTYIGLDLATVTGMATHVPTAKYGWQTYTWSLPKDETRYGWLLDKLNDTFGSDIINDEIRVAIERPIKTPQSRLVTYEILCGLNAIAIAWCVQNNIVWTRVPPTTLKKDATGFGHAKKEQMIEEARKIYSRVKNDHEADALHLANYMYKYRDLPIFNGEN